MNSENNFDLIIIGGGAAGMMAAISAKRSNPSLSVAIVDRTYALGRKVLVCGAGRCNITNINLNNQIDRRYYGASLEFINGVFSQFSYEDIVKFFNDLGIELYVERKTDIGKLFPVTDQALTVVSLLVDELQRLGVKWFLNTEVTEIKLSVIGSQSSESTDNRQLTTDNDFILETNIIDRNGAIQSKTSFSSKYLILSAGGKSYPALGSNGSGYDLALNFGHKLIQPVPSALPIETETDLIKELEGQKTEIEVSSIIDDEKIKTTKDDVMFTRYGLSGPAILNISREISIHFNREMKNNAFVSLNFFPGKDAYKLKSFLSERWQKRPSQTISKSLFGVLPNKIALALIQITGIDVNKIVSDLSQNEIDTICVTLSALKLKVTGTRGWNEAEFTAGGIDTKDVKTGSLESKLIPNLYFCGEILDVDGDVGGFNLSWSWASGNVAGKLLKK